MIIASSRGLDLWIAVAIAVFMACGIIAIVVEMFRSGGE
jgi:hypothetical protein